MSDELKKEVFERFDGFPVVDLATADEGQPRVRPVTLLYLDGRFYVATGTGSNKVKQIQRNPRVEFCLRVSEGENIGYVRAAGAAQVVVDTDTYRSVAERCTFFKEYWKGPDDPTYTLIELKVEEIEYLRPGEFETHTFPF